jgi:phosphohistidine phosphatase
MLLYVMRHGSAEDRADSGLDGDRALNADGRARVKRVIEELRSLRGGAPVARLLTSPLRRARETAELAAELGLLAGTAGGGVELHDDLSLEADPPVGLATALADGGDALLIGHQPNVEALVRELAPGPVADLARSPLAAGFCTAMLVGLEPGPRPPEEAPAPLRWQVRLVIDPRRLS